MDAKKLVRALYAPPPEVVETAFFIEEIVDGTMRVEICLLTKTEVIGERADALRRWAIEQHQDEVQQLASILLPFVKTDQLGVWVDVGFYEHKNPGT